MILETNKIMDFALAAEEAAKSVPTGKLKSFKCPVCGGKATAGRTLSGSAVWANCTCDCGIHGERRAH